MPEGISAAPAVGGGTVDAVPDEEQEQPVTPVMPTPPFPTFRSTPTLPQQPPGHGFQSGRDSRAR